MLGDCLDCKGGGLRGGSVLDVNGDGVTVRCFRTQDTNGYGLLVQTPGGNEGLEDLTVDTL